MTEITTKTIALVKEAEKELATLDLRTLPKGPQRDAIKDAKASLATTRKTLAAVK